MISYHQLPKCDFQSTFVNPKPKQLLWPITTDTKKAMNQSEFETIDCNRVKRGKTMRLSKPGLDLVLVLIVQARLFHPITESDNAKPRQTRSTFDPLLKLCLRLSTSVAGTFKT